MQSNNPVFRRSEEFNRAGGQTQQTYAQQSPSTWQTSPAGGAFGYDDVRQTPANRGGAMSIDSVVQKTAITLGVVILTALATWILTPDIDGFTTSSELGTIYGAAMFGALGAFALSMVNSFKRVVSPALVLAFAALEGVALGAISKAFDAQFGDGVVSGAVIGTFAAFAGTLTAYKVFNIQVGAKFKMFVMAAVFGMIGLSLMELVLSLFGAQIGLFGVSGLGMVTAFAGLVLGVFMLIMDFDFVEQGIRNQLPERESWRAAFAMTVSLVWIYTNLLRILAFFSQD
ncbi:Bax inhibitor-1/YccA family protein [Nocardioides dongxiaopingii]|uniref:Bax inhibitor-1/YccA family protein n=1 Tax=Nocardioides sp. S-1144 TaxID=2582905 RepID=UPI00110F50D8|nr:Bax inhibitor-1/YccA family protein [Nocardioides sp. S-1144]QCW50032.1 Bax inhibitor-1/YccA family protein [Nocardioides sp. S-1144]